MPRTRRPNLTLAKRRSQQIRNAETNIEQWKADRREAMLRANRTENASYSELVAELGISDGLVCKEMRRAKQDHPDLT